MQSRIPKIIHYVWLSGEPYPDRIRKCIYSWRVFAPEYELRLWDAKAFDMNSVKWVSQSFAHKNYELVTDYLRFYALYNYGGVYLDADVELVRNIDDLLNDSYFWCYEYTGIPEAAIIGAEAKLKWIKECLNWYETHVPYDEDGKFHRIVCPRILQYGFETVYKIELIDVGKTTEIDEGKIYPYDYFSPKNGFSGVIEKTDNTYAIHHFNSAWLKKDASVQVRRKVHLMMIRIMGKNNYNKLMYKIRNNIHKI